MIFWWGTGWKDKVYENVFGGTPTRGLWGYMLPWEIWVLYVGLFLMAFGVYEIINSEGGSQTPPLYEPR